MQSSTQTQTPFNGIRGLNNLRGLFPIPKKANGFNVIEKARQDIIQYIDDLKYYEGMLYAYDGDEKGVRRQLRVLLADSRDSILIALRKLKAPNCLLDRPKYESTYDWISEIETWLPESGPLRVSVGEIFKYKGNGNGKRV